MSNQEFLKVQSELDEKGKLTTIKKVDNKLYNLIVNYEVVLTRKQRRSLKSHVIKMHERVCPDSKLIENKNAKA
ncbi:MAG TPA: hypothetical protein VGC65_00255 [Bacteroidia bacterium]|jgi:organic hydroperoxide reductase OsmC/OhrA